MSQLILLNTPIGNIKDITDNVKNALSGENIFVVEDTRKFKALLSALKIESKIKDLLTFHDHSHDDQIGKVMKHLDNKQDVYVVSEAGSPIVSDPAYPLIRAAIEKGHTVTSHSGVSSVINALELSGLPPYPFHFYGFYPRDNEKKNILKELLGRTPGTHLFFESPHRIIDTITDLSKEFSSEDFSVVREISKLHESVYRFKGEEWESISHEVVEKGEFVVCLNVSRKDVVESKASFGKIQTLAQDIVDGKKPNKSLAKLLGHILDRDTKEIYSLLNNH